MVNELLQPNDLALLNGSTWTVREIFARVAKKTLATLVATIRLCQLQMPSAISVSSAVESLKILRGSQQGVVEILLARPEMHYLSQSLSQQALMLANDQKSSFLLERLLYELGRFAASALILDRRDGEVLLSLDSEGRLVLPGCHFSLYLGEEYEGQLARFCLDKGRVLVSLIPSNKSWIIPIDIVDHPQDWLEKSVYADLIEPVYWVGQLFEINNRDNLLRSPSSRLYQFELIDASRWGKWRTNIEAALASLNTFAYNAYDEISHFVKVIVPVISTETNVNVSASFPETIGSICMSLSSDYLVTVETLVHEYAHNKLNAIFVSDRIISNMESNLRVYSPWKDEFRPLSGILHAIFAFSNVCQVWQRYLNSNSKLSRETLFGIRYRTYELHRKLMIAMEELESVADFTNLGRAIIDNIKSVLASNETLIASLPERERTFIDTHINMHKLTVSVKDRSRRSY